MAGAARCQPRIGRCSAAGREAEDEMKMEMKMEMERMIQWGGGWQASERKVKQKGMRKRELRNE